MGSCAEPISDAKVGSIKPTQQDQRSQMERRPDEDSGTINNAADVAKSKKFLSSSRFAEAPLVHKLCNFAAAHQQERRQASVSHTADCFDLPWCLTLTGNTPGQMLAPPPETAYGFF